MARFLIGGVALVVTLYALIDCIQTPRAYARTLPKLLWLVLVVIVPFVGAVGWLVAGRPERTSLVSSAPGRRGSAPPAPDDDPAFLRKLADDEWSRRMRERRDGSDPEQSA